jgi:hypothetical protein
MAAVNQLGDRFRGALRFLKALPPPMGVLVLSYCIQKTFAAMVLQRIGVSLCTIKETSLPFLKHF